MCGVWLCEFAEVMKQYSHLWIYSLTQECVVSHTAFTTQNMTVYETEQCVGADSMNLLSHNINSFFYEYIHAPRNVLCLSLELVMTFLSTRHLHSHIDMLCLEGKYMSFFHSLPSLICLNKFLLSMITGWYMCESFSVCLYSWFGAHISRQASVLNTVPPGHDA